MRRAARVLAALVLALPAAPAAAQEADPGAFWAVLGDATLDRLIARAADGTPHVAAAEARAGVARAGRRGAALNLAPTARAEGGYTRQRLSGALQPGGAGTLPDQEIWEMGVRVSWDVDVFGRGRGILRGRSALLEAAEADVHDVRVQVAAEVAAAYFELRGAQDRLAVARRNAGNQRGTLALTRDRLEAGRGTAVDTERAQAQLSSTLAGIPTLEAAEAAARHRMAALLGRPAATLAGELEPAPGLPALPAPAGLAVVDGVLRDRADVRAAERQLAASRAFAAAARADHLPRVSIGGMAGYTAAAFESIGGTGTPRYAVGPVVSIPVPGLGGTRAESDRARAAQAEAASRFEQALLHAHAEAEVALAVYAAAHERLRHLEDAAGASERAADLVRLRFEEGATGFLEVLDAERTMLEAQDRLSHGRAEAAAGLVSVFRALGGRWPAGSEPPP